jgi:hypothetical protein
MAGAAGRFREALGLLAGTDAAAMIEDAEVFELPAELPPWTATGLEFRKGEPFTVYAEGRVVLSEEAGLWNGPRFHLWARVGGRGPLLNPGQDSYVFEAPNDGLLELAIGLGEWSTRDGEIDPAPYAAGQGQIDVLVVRWKGDPARGARALAEAFPGEALFAAEVGRLADPNLEPEGWRHLWFLGRSDIFSSERGEHGPSIRVTTSDDVGILQKPVDFPLAEDTRIRWRWKVDELPSARPENSLPTHDYLSLAIEFENGQDLTYYWSSEMPVGTHFRCPLPDWDRRETHWVVRSGSAGLGEWHAEERSLRADYLEAVGEPPERIVAVWLIAVSIFQKGLGQAEFAEVEISSGAETIAVL